MNKLKANLSSGPDGLPPLLFKRLKHCLAGPLAMIYTKCTNVLESINDWTLSVNDKHGVTVVYIDFSRAFDTVLQRKLIEARLTSYGIGGNLLD